MKQHATKLTATGFALALAGVLPATGIAQAVPEPTAPANPAGAEQQNQQTNPKVKTANELEAAKKAAQESAAKAAEADSKAQTDRKKAQEAAKESGEKSAASEKAKKDALNALAKAQADSKTAALDAANQLEKANEKKTAAEDAAKTATEALTKAEQAKAAADKKVADNPAPDAGELQTAKDKVAKAEKDKQAAVAKQEEAQKELTEAQEKANIAQTQWQAAQDEKAKAETAKQAADADVNTKQQKVNELEAKVKQLSENADQALKDGQAAVEAAKAQVQVAKDAAAQRQTELTNAQNAVTAAQNELQTKRGAVEQAKSNKVAAEQAVQTAANQVKAAQGELAKAEAALTARQGETATAKQKADEAKAAQQKAEENLAKARENKQKADAAVKAAETEVENAKKAVAEADANFSKGSFGFFESVGATDALDILKDKTTTADDGTLVNGALKPGAADDTTNLDNMKEAIAWVRVVNQYRAKGGRNGEKLDDYVITDRLMAIAQAQANWSRYKVEHSSAFSVAENLAWGKSDPVARWYAEKSIYDDAVKQHPDMATMSSYEIFQKYPTIYFKVGHYLNIVGHSTATGFAGAAGPDIKYGAVWGEVCDGVKQGEKTYTVDEYEQRFMDYYNSVTPEGAKQKLADAKAKLAELQAAAKTAGDDIATAEAAVADARAKTQDKDNAWKAAQDKESKAAAAVESEEQKVTAAENSKKAAEKVVQEKEQAVQVAAEAVTAAEGALENAKAGVAAAQKTLEAAQQNIKDKEAAQAEKEKELEELAKGTALGTAQQELSETKAALADAKAQAQAAAAQLQKATQEQQLAEQAKTAADKDLEEATTANQQAVEAVSQAENERSAAQQALNPLAEQQIAHDQLVAKAEKVAQDLKQAKAAADKANKDLEVVTKVATDLQNEQKAKQALAEKLKAIKGQSALENGLDAADSDLDNLGLPALFKTYQGADTAAKDAQKKADELARLAKEAEDLQKAAAEVNRQAQSKLAAAQAEYSRYHQVQAAASTNRVRSFAPGETLQVHFTGFSPGSKNRVIMHSTIVDLGVHPAVGKGEFYVSVQVPKELGAHTITATNEWGESASFKFEVAEKQPVKPSGKKTVRTVVVKGANTGKPAAGEQMPVTGVSVTTLLALNSLAVITGVGLVAASRRRSQEV